MRIEIEIDGKLFGQLCYLGLVLGVAPERILDAVMREHLDAMMPPADCSDPVLWLAWKHRELAIFDSLFTRDAV